MQMKGLLLSSDMKKNNKKRMKKQLQQNETNYSNDAE